MKRYCGYENSSLTYEKAEQLMGAVLYCIHEYESGNETGRRRLLTPAMGR